MRGPPTRVLAVAMVLLAGILGALPATAAERRLYAIGNSLTASMLPFSVPGFASQQGDTFTVGFHTQSGAALDFIVANPSTANITYPVTLDGAFTGYTWSDISLEPYPSPTSTLGSDVASIQSVMNSARAGTSGSARLYIYCAWPSQASFAGSGFAAYWRGAVPDVPTQPTVLARAHMDHVHARVTAALGGSTGVYVIPVGDVLAALDDQIRAGQVPGITDIRQLYVDNDHLGDVGKFIAGLTVNATLFRKNPAGLSIPFGYVQGTGAAQLTPELATQLESLVWKVLNSDPLAGVNSTPLAVSQTLSAANATAVAITLAASDAEGSSLTYSVVSGPAHGSLSGQPPSLTYQPAAGFSGTDSFSFKANDGGLDSAPATISITVAQAPPPPPPADTGGGGAMPPGFLLALAGLLFRSARRKMGAIRRA